MPWLINTRKFAFGSGNGEKYTEHHLGLIGTKCYFLMDQVNFWTMKLNANVATT